MAWPYWRVGVAFHFLIRQMFIHLLVDMIKVEIPRKNSINFLFDMEGAKDLLATFKQKQGTVYVQASKVAEIHFFPSDDEFIQFSKNSIELYMSSDAYDYGVFQISRFADGGDIFPAEFYEFEEIPSPKGRKKMINTYLIGQSRLT